MYSDCERTGNDEALSTILADEMRSLSSSCRRDGLIHRSSAKEAPAFVIACGAWCFLLPSRSKKNELPQPGERLGGESRLAYLTEAGE